MSRWMLIAAALVLSFSPAWGEEVDNPIYQDWARFKPGTKVEYKTVSEVAGNQTETMMSYTLVEVNDDVAIVEMKVATIMMGNKYEQPPMKMEHKAKVETTDGETPAQEAERKEGKETVEAAGQTFETKWYETTSEQHGMKTTVRTWMSESVPGGMVKAKNVTDGAMKMVSETVLVQLQIVE